MVASLRCSWSGVRLVFPKPSSQKHFLTSSERCDAHLYGGLGLNGYSTMNSMIGFSVNVFVPSGNPKGLRTIEKSNWSGLGLVFPRDDFSEQVRLREEIQHPGVYLLWGPGESDDPHRPQVYIGECDTLVERLANHNNTDDKPFWQETIVFTSTDRNLNKAHVLFIEAQLVNIARQANRCDLINIQNPNEPNLSDREKSYAQEFLEAMLLCLPIAGVPFFDKLPFRTSTQESLDMSLPSGSGFRTPELFTLRGAQSGTTRQVYASGYINGAEFIVLATAKAAKDEVASAPNQIRAIRNKLIHDGQFIDRDDFFELRDDTPFNSPSAASGAMLGRSSNGRNEWKNSDGMSINDRAKSPVDG